MKEKCPGFVIIDENEVEWGFSHLGGKAPLNIADRPFYSVEEANEHKGFLDQCTIEPWNSTHKVPPMPAEESWISIFVITCAVVCVVILRLGGWI